MVYILFIPSNSHRINRNFVQHINMKIFFAIYFSTIETEAKENTTSEEKKKRGIQPIKVSSIFYLICEEKSCFEIINSGKIIIVGKRMKTNGIKDVTRQ